MIVLVPSSAHDYKELAGVNRTIVCCILLKLGTQRKGTRGESTRNILSFDNLQIGKQLEAEGRDDSQIGQRK